MNDTPRLEGGTRARAGGDEEELRELLETAGARPEVAPGDLSAVRAAARAEWVRLSKGGARRRPVGRAWIPALLAATLLVALALVWRAPGAPLPSAESIAEPVATIEMSRGEVRFDPPRGALGSPGSVAAGSWIETGSGARAGRLALRLAGGGSLRFDAATRARMASAERIELERGAVYFDSGSSSFAGRPIEVTTPFGVVREIGTQFEVRVAAGAGEELEVGVREGRVTLALGANPARSEAAKAAESAEAGEWLSVRRDGGVRRRPIERGAPEWSWILEATPAMAIEGRTLRSLLDWACRETGWELRFEDAELEREAETIRLHGAADGLRPDQVVDVGLAGAGLGRRLEGRLLVVTRRASD